VAGRIPQVGERALTSRRGFLAALGAFALDPERLLWQPGARLISIPAPRVLPFLAVGDICTFGLSPGLALCTAAVYRDAGSKVLDMAGKTQRGGKPKGDVCPPGRMRLDPQRYIVTVEARSMNEIGLARFKLANPWFDEQMGYLPVEGLYTSRFPQTHSRVQRAS
jgi:hypothetical protein